MPNKFLITGITGTLGTKITEKLLARFPDCQIVGISRDEQKQQAFPIKDGRLALRIADVRNSGSLGRAALEKFDVIYHLAALKCAPILEANPSEALLTNVTGTENVLALARLSGSKVCFVSSDKAVYPINIYGMTKAAGEKLVAAADNGHAICRYGNVIGSRGSFFPALLKSLKKGKAYLTHPEMTRFWLTIDQVAEFVISHGLEGNGIGIPSGMKSAYVRDMIDKAARLSGLDNYELVLSGVRPGEKLHEHIRTRYEKGSDGMDHSSNEMSYLMSDRRLGELVGECLGAV